MADVVKTGILNRYSKSFMDGGWKKVQVKIFRDSVMAFYKKPGSSEANGQFRLKDVCKFFAFGQYTEGMEDRPSLPPGTTIDCLIAIPEKPSRKAKIHWFAASNPNEVNEWMQAITSTLPPPPNKGGVQNAPNPNYIQPQTSSQVSGAPPGYAPPPYSAGPPPPGGPPLGGPPPPAGGIGFAPVAQPYPQQPPAYPQGPPAYPQQPYAQPQQPYAPPPQQYAQPNPYQQQYPQQPPPGAYPQQPYAQQPYAQQPAYGYQQPAAGYAQPNVQYVQQPPQVVHVQGKKSGMSNTTKMAAGLIGGAALGYGASRMMGGGMGMMGGGMWGMGPRWGSWSSLSSFGSCGSFSSFGSCGSW